MLAAPPAASRPRPPRAAAVPGEARATRRPRLASRRLAVCCTAAASTSSGPSGGAQTGGERPREDWGTISSAGGSSSSSSTQSSDSEDGAQPFQEGYYDWRWGSRIKYYQAGDSGPPLVLVHGFGVGGYHFSRNFRQLSERFRVYAFDLLGQGGSWPGSAGEVEPDPDLGPLVYSAETWTRQLLEFMRDVAGVAPGAPAYVAGNSLGGFLAVNLAGQHPEMVKGLVLLNATPFWSFRSEGASPGIMATLKLDGTVPVPKTVKLLIERLWWRNLADPTTISGLLSLVYARPVDDELLLQRILAATEHPGAIDAFASIVLSPKTKASFDENLRRLACPVLLCYGQADPWVVPMWGQRFKRAVPHAAYYELAEVGHCPHHEAPNAVNRVLTSWVTAVEERLAALASNGGGGGGGGGGSVNDNGSPNSSGSGSGNDDPLLVHGELGVGQSMRVAEARGGEVVVTHVAGAPRNVFERADAALFALRRRLSTALGGGTAAPV